ncbi:dTMP kinase [Thermosulfurimonas dismutans]|uniref:Thymidylate kinase n=1 Tax=Thermosulfurimonas dismutans TaxID=999894 RepID=A0A179D4G8_9BACT|nr:dTMP kinase [Thermosulfurimonas dismutans]OAQ20957.1 Thymidylate kinase [Thermosulfurimonas dismutans]
MENKIKIPAHGRRKVLVHGLPGSGKTTLIERVAERLAGPKKGFVTREVREGGRRVGFKIYTLDGREAWLAKRGRGWPQVGKYKVFLETFEKLALSSLELDSSSGATPVFIVDEIGKMEIFSEAFRERMRKLLSGPEPLLASVGYGKVPFLEEILSLKEPIFCEITPDNRDFLVTRILVEFERPGRLIVFEGLDGSGKSTLAREVYQELKSRGIPAIFTQEPTRGEWGEKIREHLAKRTPLSPQAYAELFLRDRREHAEKILVPALLAGKIVICDRYYPSTLAYQGSEGLDVEELLRKNETVAPVPDLVVFIDVSEDLALERIKDRGEPHELYETRERLSAIKELYFEILPRFNYLRLSGDRPVSELCEEVLDALPYPNKD